MTTQSRPAPANVAILDGLHDGVRVHNLLASYAHLRTGAGSDWAPAFVNHVRRERFTAGRLRPMQEDRACST